MIMRYINSLLTLTLTSYKFLLLNRMQLYSTQVCTRSCMNLHQKLLQKTCSELTPSRFLQMPVETVYLMTVTCNVNRDTNFQDYFGIFRQGNITLFLVCAVVYFRCCV